MATLYRKYRSATFGEVIGQDPIVTTLTNQVKLGRIGHAYLFTGSRGTGKTTCARIFARAVNCLSPVNGSPCGECEVCKKLASDNVDIIEMDAASNNGVDDARDIREKVKYLPVSCKYKVYIIDEVHMLTGGAFNALLKTIEEPPEHVIFILATTEPQKLPQTILSRCIRFDFRLVPTEEIAKHIAKIYDAEGIKYTDKAVEEIARMGEGSVRDALSVADTLMSAADVITPELVQELTGAGDGAAVAEMFDRTLAHDLKGALLSVDRFSKSGKSMAAVARQLTEYARNALVVKSVGGGSSPMINADSAALARMAETSERFSVEEIAKSLEAFSAAENGLKYSVNPRVFLETALVKMILGSNENDDLRRRVSALEKRLSAGALPAEQKKNKVTIDYVPPERIKERAIEPPPPPEPSFPEPSPEPLPPKVKSETATKFGAQEPSGRIKSADEGEFLHLKAKQVTGLEILGKVSTYLRKKGTADAARARELLSRDAAIKERDDAFVFVVPDEGFIAMTDPTVIRELNEALTSCGIEKRARIEKKAEDLYADDLMRAKELFGRDAVVPLKA